MNPGFNRLNVMPRQYVSDNVKKTKEWQRDNIDSFENLILFENRQLKNSYYNKFINYNLYRGILDERDVQQVCDPRGIGLNTFPAKMQHIGIGNSKIRLLKGEHIKRNFDWKVFVSNPDGISSKEERKMSEIRRLIMEIISSNSENEEEIKNKLEKQKRYLKYEFQDIAELAAKKILDYSYYNNEIKYKFDEAFTDGLLTGEQYMFVNEMGNELQVRKGDPMRIFTLMSSESTTEDGLEALVEVSYHTVSSIIDDFYDYLSEEDLDKLNQFRTIQSGLNRTNHLTYPKYGHIGELAIPEDSLTAKTLHTLTDIERNFFATNFDVNGNIRRLYCIWRSKRKVNKISYIDENGVEREKTVHEKYLLDENKGESLIKSFYINEWWEGYKIGNDVYCKIRPIPFLANTIENISKQKPPVIIQLYSTNSSKAQSLMDIIKPLDYLYDIISYKRELLINKLKGDILSFPVTMIPNNMTMGEFMNYVESTGDLPLDPSAEIIDGPQAGRAASQINNTVTPNIISSTQGGPISILNEVLSNIIQTMDSVSGITQQRQGSVSTHELVGNVERSVTQSSHITEPWFATNDYFKRRTLRRVLDTQIRILKKHPKKIQYILDDTSINVIQEEEIQEASMSEFDIHVTDGSKDALVLQKAESLFQGAIQSGTATFSDLMDIFYNQSVSKAIRDLKAREEERKQKESEIQQAANENQKMENETNARIEEMKLQLEKEKLEIEREKMYLDNETKIAVAEIGAYKFQENLDQNNNNIPDPSEIADRYLKERQIISKEIIEDKKIQETKIQNRSQEKIARESNKLKEKELEIKEKQLKQQARNKSKSK